MDEHVQKLIRELRSETCPRAVLDRVAERIARGSVRRRPAQRFAWVVVSLFVFGALVVWNRQGRRDVQINTMEIPAQAQADRALVIQQTQGALVYIGHVLLEAAAHTENAILTEAVPPLRNGLETAKNKVTNPI